PGWHVTAESGRGTVMRRLAAMGALMAILAAACGGGGGGSKSATLVRDSPKKTTSTGSARIDVLTERAASGDTPATTVRLQGEVDFGTRRGQMSIDLSQLGLPGGPVDAVFDNTIVYTKLPP